MQRRALLKLGAASAAVLAVIGGAAALVQPGLARGALTLAGRAVFSATANAVLDRSLPDQAAARSTAMVSLLGRIDVLIGALPLHAQAELSQLLSILATSGGRRALAGLVFK